MPETHLDGGSSSHALEEEDLSGPSSQTVAAEKVIEMEADESDCSDASEEEGVPGPLGDGVTAERVSEDPALFAAYATERLLRVMLVRATFEERNLGKNIPLMRCVWRYLDSPILWQFLSNDGWAYCDTSTQSALQDAEREGERQVTLRVRSWSYVYDLDAREQINSSSNRRRQLRRVNPWSAPRVLNISNHSTQDPTLPRWQFSTGFGWADCDECTQQLLREAQANSITVVHGKVRDWDYVFDLTALTQTNSATNRSRTLRLAPAPSVSSSSR